MLSDIRSCEQCGTSFVPRREHARFCSARCRAEWNQQHACDPRAETCALQWSLIAMNDTIERLSRTRAARLPRAFATIGEAVWWVAIVDATLVRHHPQAYDSVMALQAPARRRLVEGTLTGLRFVRNQIGDRADLSEFIEPGDPGPGQGKDRITGWTWKPVPEPALETLSPRGRAWQMTRYRAYQAHLAGHPVTEGFGRAASFLNLAAANAPSVSDAGPRPEASQSRTIMD